MFFSLKMQLIAVVQVILTAVFTYLLVTSQYKDLSAENLRSLETFLIEQKQTELKNYTSIARASINHIYNKASPFDEEAKEQVKAILSTLIYEQGDGYFFAYQENGVNVVHPTEPELVGQDLWAFTNVDGEPTIQILIKHAKNGGDFHQYAWSKPTTKELTQKMSYAEFLPDWGWMFGTGVYLDSVETQLTSIQQAIDTQVNKTRSIILLVALSSIFMIFVVGTILHFKHKRLSDEKISQLGQKIVTMQEEEQRHISRELHDGIVQVLVSIKYSLEATGIKLRKDKVEKPVPLQKAEENLTDAINEIRRISHHLHPRILDELGISEAMEALTSEFSERTGIEVSIYKPALKKLLPDTISTTLYRVLQECLVNIEKHANATKVRVGIEISNNWLTLKIEDNGKGISEKFDDNAYEQFVTSGIGLRNLTERVEYHSGQFKLHSSPSGTIVIARIPKHTFANYYYEKNQVKLETRSA